MSDLRELMRVAFHEHMDQRTHVIEERMLALLGTGQDLAMWERHNYDAASPGTEMVFRVIPGGSRPDESPEGWGKCQCTVYRVSEVKVGKA